MFEHILVPMDGSLTAQNALYYAEQIALKFSSEVILLQVVDPLGFAWQADQDPDWPLGMDAQSVAQMEEAEENAANTYLNHQVARLARSDVHARFHVMEGRGAEQILACARTEKADLIVMGSHGRTGLGRLLMGSVADRVLKDSPAPVLLVRHKTASA